MEILLVEDNKIIQWVLKNNLTTLGFSVDTATHGKHALDLFSKKRYDLVLLDMYLPDMFGIDVGRVMRETGKLWVNIVGITNNADDVKFDCLRAGFNAVYTKPISVVELENITKKWAKLKIKRHVG